MQKEITFRKCTLRDINIVIHLKVSTKLLTEQWTVVDTVPIDDIVAL